MNCALKIQESSIGCLALIGQLLGAFDDAGIRYVHWKSNTNIAKALVGVDDLDILVHPEDRVSTEAIFKRLRIIRALSPKDSWQRDIFHFIGADVDSGVLVHVHVHYALPVGFDYDKNYVLPIVDAYLDGRWKHGPIFLPEVEKEYVVLVVRLVIKNALAPLLLQLPNQQWRRIKTARSGGVVQGGGYAEFVDLAARSDRPKVDALLDGPFSFIGRAEFELCEQALASNNSLPEYFRAASRLKKRLRGFGTNSEGVSFSKAFGRLMLERAARVRAKVTRTALQRKRSALGGRVIAFVGGDGAGKSTNVASLAKALAQKLPVRTVHIGRPGRSFSGSASRALAIAARVAGLRDHATALNYLAIALNRRAAFRKACSWRERGHFVVVDRVPLPGITRMDCPRIHSIVPGKFKRLSAWEARLHAEIRGVDALIVLKLDPAIALARRPEDDAAELVLRSGEIWDDAWHAPYATVIDTGAKDEACVRREVLIVAWDCISRPFLKLEIVGLSGAGKSTLTKQLREQIPNLLTSLPYRRHPLTTLAGACRGMPTALRAFRRTSNGQVAKNCLQLFAAAALSRRLRRADFPAANLVLDQGPVFQLALAHKEGAVSHVVREIGMQAGGFLRSIIRLDVTVDELRNRIRQRQAQAGRGQALGADAFERFCDEYNSGFDYALAGLSLPCISVDGMQPMQEVARDVLRQVRLA